ncbi:MAG: GerMN domain-containing protein [Acidimicrobiia bacterium]|nr:GerMN domain-containing protein [Acidimicrobiia bacterium]
MTTTKRFTGLAAAVLLVAPGAGCGLPDDDRPRVISEDEAPLVLASPEAASSGAGRSNAQLYFVNELSRLTIVLRPVPVDDLEEAMEALLAGPTDDERGRAISTAIPVDTVLLDAEIDAETGIATIDLGPAGGGVSAVGGEEQRTAFAQLVLSAAEVDGVQAVRFEVEGTAIDIPTDAEPTADPVTPADYAALDPTLPPTTAPVPAATSTPVTVGEPPG